MALLTLRIEHAAGDGDSGQVRLLLRDSERILADDRKPFLSVFGEADIERLRWYWEDYLDEPAAESRTVEKQAERRLALVGEALFRQLFELGEARRLWNTVSTRLPQVRIEAADLVQGAAALPWELLREPSSGRWVAQEAAEFARVPQHRFPEAPPSPGDAGRLRVLLVLSSPRVGGLGFESAVRAAPSGLDQLTGVEWHILRPPTYSTLTRVLTQAESSGRPFHAVHFEGAGYWCDLADRAELPAPIRAAARSRNEKPIEGARGFLLLDQAVSEDRLRLVGGAEVAELLAEARTPLITLANRCRPGAEGSAGLRPDSMRAFHDFADHIVNEGAASVVQIPFRLSPDGAGLFFFNLYGSLAAGASVSEAVALGRRRLAEAPQRVPLGQPRVHRDWAAIRAHEPFAVRLVAPPAVQPEEAGVPTSAPSGPPALAAASGFPDPPPSGRMLRDKPLLDLERELTQGVVGVLHGPAGAGKTQLAADLAHWTSHTASIDGPTIYSDLTEHRGLASLLDELAILFGNALRANGIDWEPMGDQEHLEAALLVLSQIPVLWVWDSFEVVRGKQGATPSWSVEERERLLQFLDLIPDTQARVLIVSRDEERWLGPSLKRRACTPWNDRELLRLVSSVIAKEGVELLLSRCDAIVKAAAGNPLTARILTRLVLEKDLHSPLLVLDLVRKIGEEASEHPPIPALEPGLSAVLQHVLHHSLSDPELEIAALAHLFPRVLDTKVLERMASPHRSWGLRELNTRGAFKRAVAGAPDSPIERIIDFGFLSRLGARHCRIEPVGAVAFEAALELLRPAKRRPGLSGRLTLFSMKPGGEDDASPGRVLTTATRLGKVAAGSPPPSAAREPEAVRRATAAFVEALAELGAEAARAHQEGARQVVSRMTLEESGFQRAIELAIERAWWRSLTGLVAGLGTLYDRGNRLSAWGDMLERTARYGSDPTGGAPMPGRERLWHTITDQRVRLATRRQSTGDALELQKAMVKWDRAQARELDKKPVEELTNRQKATTMSLARSLNRLSAIGCSAGRPITEAENHAVELCEQLGEHRLAAEWAFRLGVAYTEKRAIRDLSRAERWLKRAIDLLPDDDAARARFLASLGQVAWERFRASRQSEKPESELIRHLTDARRHFEQAIEHDDPKDYVALASHHLQYAHVSYSLGDIDRAVPNYRESIRYDQMRGHVHGAARTRFNLAIALRDAGRLGEARKYAVAAFGELRGVRGPVTEGLLDRSRRLVMHIERKLEEKRDKHLRRFAAHVH